MKEKKFNKLISQELITGAFSNLVDIKGNDIEIIIDFLFTEPDNKQSVVISRVIMSNERAKKFNELLSLYFNNNKL